MPDGSHEFPDDPVVTPGPSTLPGGVVPSEPRTVVPPTDTVTPAYDWSAAAPDSTYDWATQYPNIPTNAAGYGAFDFATYARRNSEAANTSAASDNPYESLYRHYLTNTESFNPGQYWQRGQALTQYNDPATGSVRKDLLGGAYTDPNTIPIEVLAERQALIDQGFKGAWGAGAGGRFAEGHESGMTDATGKQTIKGYMADSMTNPSLPAGTFLTPELMQVGEGELLDSNGYQLDPNAVQANQTLAQATEAKAADKTAAGSYDATEVNITDDATVQGQMAELMKQFEGGQIPAWAAGAMRKAQGDLAARGMGASSIAAQTVIQTAMESAMPIAMADAETRAKALFTNAASHNAAKQFNAQSQQQNDQFFANLETTVSQFNADQKNAISKFNAGEANAISQFNATLRDSREKFNTSNRLVIDQSNAQWRRSINTANTAIKNSTNQFNATNLLNISNSAMNNLWQDWRDAADFAFTGSENAKTRAHNIAMATIQQQQWIDRFDTETQNSFYEGLGSLGVSVFSEMGKGIVSKWFK
jgi:hypothetical protein